MISAKFWSLFAVIAIAMLSTIGLVLLFTSGVLSTQGSKTKRPIIGELALRIIDIAYDNMTGRPENFQE